MKLEILTFQFIPFVTFCYLVVLFLYWASCECSKHLHFILKYYVIGKDLLDLQKWKFRKVCLNTFCLGEWKDIPYFYESKSNSFYCLILSIFNQLASIFAKENMINMNLIYYARSLYKKFIDLDVAGKVK